MIPDLSALADVTVQYLPRNLTDVKVKFFAEGTFNELYIVHSTIDSQQYIMRLTLPVEPLFKTESQCVTLSSIQTYTSIPVPDVVAYDSSAKTPLGFEWIL